MTTLHQGLLQVARISTPADPAFDTRSPKWFDAVKRYVRTRSPEDLAALPRKAGRTPVLYGIAVLTPAQYEECSRLKDVAHYQMLARVGVRSITLADGKVDTAPKDPSNEAGDAWLARIQAVGGARLVAELGQVARLRTEIGDIAAEEVEGDEDPLARSDLYSLPSGAPLAVLRKPASDADAPSSTNSATTPG